MTTLVLSPTFHLWGLTALKMDHVFLFLFSGDLFLVVRHSFLIFFTGLETAVAGVLHQSVETCDFAILGVLCEFWKIFR